VFTPLLEDAGYNVRREMSLDVFADVDAMAAFDLIVPIWTQGAHSRRWRLASSDEN